MGGVVNKIPIVRDVVRTVAKPIVKTRRFEKGHRDKDPNRLAYQWDVKKAHDDSKFAADTSRGEGAFTGQVTDYADLARKARASTDATGQSAQNEALDRARNRAAELRSELEGTRGAISGMRAESRNQLERDMRENVVDRIQGESAEAKAARIQDKVKAEGGEMNIFGTKKDIKMPGDPGYGATEEEEDKFKRPAYREFLEKIAAAKKGDFG